jgi:hypothetical protein
MYFLSERITQTHRYLDNRLLSRLAVFSLCFIYLFFFFFVFTLFRFDFTCSSTLEIQTGTHFSRNHQWQWMSNGARCHTNIPSTHSACTHEASSIIKFMLSSQRFYPTQTNSIDSSRSLVVFSIKNGLSIVIVDVLF